MTGRTVAARIARIAAQIVLLWVICRAGEWIVSLARLPLPGNVVGMVVLFALLVLGVVKEHWVQDGAAVLTRHLAFFFIPIAVGLMEWASLLWREGHWLLLALVVSMIVGLATSGAIAQRLGRGRREDPA